MLILPLPISPIITALLSSNEKEFARLLCNRDRGALAEFQEFYCDELYYIASKFCNRGIPEDAWEYRTKKGYTIYVSDDVGDTYVWLIRLAIRKSCHYRGDKGATFSTYIKSVLNSEFTFKDWLKWKTGVTGYVPKCIKLLGNVHNQVFRLLRQKKTDHEIFQRLQIDLSDYYPIYREIESALNQSNQLHLIEVPKFVSIDNSEEEDTPTVELEGTEWLLPDDQLDSDIIKQILEQVIALLSVAERRLVKLYWGSKLSVDEIYDAFSVDRFKQYLTDLKIDQPKDIYKKINQLAGKCFTTAKQKFPNEVVDYNINKKTMKFLLRQFLHNFQIEV